MKKGNIYLWTGHGGGKTTSALGVALRAVGHNKKVIIIQFMKGRKDIGEYKAKGLLGNNYNIYQFGSEGFIDLKNPSNDDKAKAREGFEFAKKAVKEKPFLLILDEINLAAAIGLINVKDIVSFLDKVPEEVNVYTTGREAPGELIDRADYVTLFTPVKYPKTDPKKSKQGIDY